MVIHFSPASLFPAAHASFADICKMNRQRLFLAVLVVVASLLAFGPKYFRLRPNPRAVHDLRPVSVPERPPVSIPNDGLAETGLAIQEHASPEQLMDATWAMPGDARIAAATLAFRHWTDLDLFAATNWLANHETDPATDHLISDVLLNNSFVKEDFHVALRWGEAISDRGQRAEALQQILLTEGIKAPEESIHYVNESETLLPEQKEYLRTSLSKALRY